MITHNKKSMEECEALCTKLAIMSRGQFQCFGSVQHLKSKYGQGYGLIMKCRRRIRGQSEENTSHDNDDVTKRVEEFMSYYVPESELKDRQQNTLFYQIQVNRTKSKSISYIFSLIEENKHLLDLETYSLTQTSLEQVFLSFAAAAASSTTTTSINTNSNDNSIASTSATIKHVFNNLAYENTLVDENETEEINL
jgi:ATP-binding cassette, subfamily A (ABC1), member 1